MDGEASGPFCPEKVKEFSLTADQFGILHHGSPGANKDQDVEVGTHFLRPTQGSSFLATAGLMDSIPLGLSFAASRLGVFTLIPFLLFPVRFSRRRILFHE